MTTRPAQDPLDLLELEAGSLEAAAPLPPGTPPPPPPVDTAAELLSTLTMVRMMVAPMVTWWPEFERVWSDQALARIAAGGAAVMEKHGLTVAGVFAEWGPYLALAGATAPPALATYQAFKAHERAERERPRQAPPPPNEQHQQTPG